MNENTLLTIAGAIILILVGVIGYLMAKVITKVDTVSDNVGKILVINGITNEMVKSHKEQIQFLQAKLHDNAEAWIELWKDYDLNSIKHK